MYMSNTEKDAENASALARLEKEVEVIESVVETLKPIIELVNSLKSGEEEDK